MSVPVTISTGAVSRFLKHIQEAGIPDKVTNPYIKSVGFKSSNDASLINVFKALGFIDGSGTPTDKWRNYRDVTKSKQILGQAIKQAYSGLFQVYADAHKKDDEAVANWIRANTSFAGITVTRAVRTFKALCNEADFSGVPAPASTPTPAAHAAVPAQNSTQSSAPAAIQMPSSSPSVNINIELHLPATNDSSVYENFFAAMKKNLFGGDE
jgi:hypothetical protein